MNPESFAHAYRRWFDMPFPSGSDDDGLDEIHSQLAYADAMVAEAALPVATGRSVSGQVPDQVHDEVRSVLARTGEYAASVDQEQVSLAAQYRGYAEALQDVIDALGEPRQENA